MSFIKDYVKDILEISSDSNQIYCLDNCPSLFKGQTCGHRFHCLDSSNEQISQTLNGLTCLLLTIHSEVEDRLQIIQCQNNKEFRSIKDKIYELSKVIDNLPKSNSKKKTDNSLILNLQQNVEGIKESIDTITYRLTSKVKYLFNSMTSEVARDFKDTINKNGIDQSYNLVKISSEIESLIKGFKIDTNNLKKIELKTEENSKEILRLNKRVIPMMHDANNAIKGSNILLNQTLDVLTKVKIKLGIEDES